MSQLPTPSIDEVEKVNHQLRKILIIATTQQAKSSLQHRIGVSVLSPGHSRAGWQKTTVIPSMAGTSSSSA
jgi:hypothetical protein